ncbi:MAG: aldo/keto reductase [Spirochaetota bacterium]|nr:aldo/keto reductase [Spirochaetota bacterium]
MKYRKFGKLDWNASVLGFGAMRLPIIDNQPSKIDVPEAERMIRYAIDQGVNYIDTAYPYHEGQSERCVGRILGDGYRERVRIATKQPTWFISSSSDFDRYLDEQLKHLQTDYIDFYLLHGLNKEYWTKLHNMGVLPWAEGAIADGRIQHLGFSFHDNYEAFIEIVDSYDNWTFCQIQYNFMDINYQAGTKGLEYAAQKGLAIVIMEPLRGGQLTKKPPEVITKLWANDPNPHTQADIALQWVWNHSEVSVVLSGMTTMQQVEENIISADRSGPDTLTKGELMLIDKMRDAYLDLCPIPCTNCRYCMPCPNSVNIPRIFEIYNEAVMYNDPRTGRFFYRGAMGLSEGERANNCVECGECEEKCPQDIPIMEWLVKAHALLGPKKKE